MKKFLLLIITAAVFIGTGKAQTATIVTHREISKPGGLKPPVIDENTVVKDSLGKELAYKEWQPLLRSGNYSIRSVQRTNEKTVYTLVKLSAADKEALIERRNAALANIPAGVKDSNSVAVTSQGVKKRVAAPVFDEKTVVKDSAGVIYPYVVWRAMMRTNDYAIRYTRKTDADSISYFLVKKTQAEKDAMMASLPKPEESDRFTSGNNFSYFNEKDLTGERFNAKTLAGKVLVLNFWFIGCPPCRAEIPDLNAVATQYKDNKDVVFIAIGLDDSYEIKDFIKSTPFNYHLIYDGRYAANKYGVHLYPTNVIINKEGKVVFSSVSNQPSNPYWIKKTIEESLAAK